MVRVFQCPMHPQIIKEMAGSCPICGMALVEIDREEAEKKVAKNSAEKESKLSQYRPLLIILGLILLSTLVLAWKDSQNFQWQDLLVNFMAGFFLIFSGFKMLDLKGFAEGYSTYDLLARRWFAYGYIYPFIELFFGLAYLTRFHLESVNWLVILVMGFSGLGVVESLLHKRKFQCACLGTVIKLPLTNVTLIEDFGMAAMALLMILIS